jgi:hypothetical protein
VPGVSSAPSKTRKQRGVAHRALIIAGSAGLAFASPELISAALAQRLLGVMLSVVVVAYANAAPKVLVPLARLRCDATTEQSLRRFTGWAVVVGGLGFGLAWVFAPIELAGLLAPALLARRSSQ